MHSLSNKVCLSIILLVNSLAAYAEHYFVLTNNSAEVFKCKIGVTDQSSHISVLKGYTSFTKNNHIYLPTVIGKYSFSYIDSIHGMMGSDKYEVPQDWLAPKSLNNNGV